MELLLMFLVSYIIVYLIYLFSVVLFRSKYDLFKRGIQVKYFVKRFGLKFKNIREFKFYNLLALLNSFVISSTFIFILLVKGLLWQLIFAFIIFIPLIFVTYELFG